MNKPTDFQRIIDGLTETQWKELYLDHARGKRTDIVPFPDEDIQIITNGMKGEATARHAISLLD